MPVYAKLALDLWAIYHETQSFNATAERNIVKYQSLICIIKKKNKMKHLFFLSKLWTQYIKPMSLNYMDACLLANTTVYTANNKIFIA